MGRPSTATPTHRICSECKKRLPHSEFFRDQRYKYGIGARCRKCGGLRNKRLGQRNKSGDGLLPLDHPLKCRSCGTTKNASEFRIDHSYRTGRGPDCKECMRHKAREWAFGISKDRFESMMHSQRGVCAICGKPEKCKGRSGHILALAVDHNHDNGTIRGLLCRQCNMKLPFVEDAVFLESAMAYLRKYGEI